MKNLIILILLTVFLSGCSFIYNLDNFTIPDNEKFLEIIESLDTPKKICNYMKDNFEYEYHTFAYNPYTMWLLNTQNKAGDCNDYATWGMFVAHYHGYEVYLMIVSADYGNPFFKHTLAIYVENGKYNYSSNQYYYPIQANTFQEIAEHHTKYRNIELYGYKVYDYEMNIIKTGVN